MTYGRFIKDLENNFLYELFNIPMYSIESGFHSLNLRSINETGNAAENYVCSVFDYSDPYVFYRDGKLKGWGRCLDIIVGFKQNVKSICR